MKRYIGLKEVMAEPHMSDKDLQEGYAVQYADGYESWSPKVTFEDTYREIGESGFSVALEGLRRGQLWARSGWNGKDMFIFMVDGSQFTVNRHPLLGIFPEGTEINYRPHIDMRTADGSIVTWGASQSDLIEEDWKRVLN